MVPFNKLFLQLVKEGYDMADIAVKNMQTDTKTKDFAKLIFKDDQCIAQAKGLSKPQLNGIPKTQRIRSWRKGLGRLPVVFFGHGSLLLDSSPEYCIEH